MTVAKILFPAHAGILHVLMSSVMGASLVIKEKQEQEGTGKGGKRKRRSKPRKSPEETVWEIEGALV
jgi:hypothetical protein